ncbi:hypothetical protein GCM10027097_18050 [Amycolatopsis acidiphila]
MPVGPVLGVGVGHDEHRAPLECGGGGKKKRGRETEENRDQHIELQRSPGQKDSGISAGTTESGRQPTVHARQDTPHEYRQP